MGIAPGAVTLGARTSESTILLADGHCDLPRERGKGGLALVRKLLADGMGSFRGPCVVLAFEPQSRLRGWPAGDIVDTRAVATLQIPFDRGELKRLLNVTGPLREEEWRLVTRRGRLEELFERVASIRHRADSLFSVGLSALMELEKLSYFKHPDQERVAGQVALVLSNLTEDGLNRFEAEAYGLLRDAAALGVGDLEGREDRIRSSIGSVKAYVAALRTAKGNVNPEGVRSARTIYETLRNVLGEISQIKGAILDSIARTRR